MQLEPGVRIGKYELKDKLGQGGFGVIFAARDTELGRDVAIKILRPEHAFRPQVVQRFLQEARAAASINHPGIVTIHESGQVDGTNTRLDGTVYIAMELLVGETLATRIKQAGRFVPGIAIGVCRQMASALAAAHQVGIVHRDLKPANIYLVRDNAVVGGERVKILDFGIAKLAEEFGGNIQTHSLVMLGTPMYMSPEQCKSSAKVDARSDIYALGCILFEMLCGRPPFDGDSGELIAKHQLVEPPTPRSFIGEIPPELDALVSGMLAKSPDARPQTMSAVLDVLDAVEDQIAPAPDPLPSGAFTHGKDAGSTTVAETPASRRRGNRRVLAAGATLAVAVGIIGGIMATGGDDAHPSAKTDNEASAREPVETTGPTDPRPEPSSGSATAGGAEVSPAVDPPTTAPRVADAQAMIECNRMKVDRDWTGCVSCARELAAQAPTSERAHELEEACNAELANEESIMQLADSVRGKDAKSARAAFEQIAEDSVYHREATELLALLDRAPAPPPRGARPTVSRAPKTTTKVATCDAEAAKDKGLGHVNAGEHAAALAAFEASLRCKDDAYVRTLAFMEACSSGNSRKATYYFTKLSPGQQDKFKQICERQDPPVAYRARCDAEASKEKGMEYINKGAHALALAQFEASLRCKFDNYVVTLAFMEACSSGNSRAAKQHFAKLNPAQQARFKQVCIRQKPPVAYE